MAHGRGTVANDSWTSRLRDSIRSVLAGFVLAGSALPLMWCNEGRAVTTERSLEEGQGLVIGIASDSVDPAHHGRLVHLTGQAVTTEVLRDPQFAVSANALKLIRTTEMYQWHEREKQVERDTGDGGKETVREYSYYKDWSERVVDSDRFHSPTGHENPKGPMPFPSTTFVASTVTLGAFTLSPELVQKIDKADRLPVAEALSSFGPAGVRMRPVDGGLYRGPDHARPSVGDLRVRWSVVRPQPVSVVAGQAGASFVPYQTRAGDALLMLAAGTQSAAAMFRSEILANRVLTWILRAAGFLFVFAGVVLVFRPIAVLGSLVPLVGSLLEAGLWACGLGFAGVLSLATIASAWVFYRPLFALALVALTAATLFWLKRRGARRAASG